MALQFNNHVALIQNIFRYPKEPTVKYLRQNLKKKLKKLSKHLIHYYRFIKAPNIISYYLNVSFSQDVGDYGSYLKLIGDLFDVKMVWKEKFSRMGTRIGTIRTVILVGNEIDVKLASKFIELMVFITEEVVRKESRAYRKIAKARRRKVRLWKTQVWSERAIKEMSIGDTRIFSSKYKLQVIYNLNSYLLELLEVKRNYPNNHLIYNYINRNLKIKYDNRRGNPTWSPNKIWEEEPKQAMCKDLLFHKDKILN